MASNNMKSTTIRTLRTKFTNSTKSTFTFTPILANRSITGTTRKSTSLESITSHKQSRSPFLSQDFIGDFPLSFIKPRKQPTASFDTLINSLTHSLTTTSTPHLPTLTKLLRNYTSNPSEWQKYAYANPSKQYTRNLVAEVEGVFNLLMLVWTPGKESKMGLHSIANPSNTEYAISLHLYTPPNAAMHGCHIFDPLTGEKTHVKPGAYDSVRGVITSDI
ncbi:hypothetical protein DID88_010010 [Monilinia fructigena]|uniref:Cysteine dioxygenase n=1 Tax=Monilinia fructigena TaxID=38457 RepID=A0A395IJY8_9HELO|nr:hypothetical protein DID88_010010 [Monilinia fructigena]